MTKTPLANKQCFVLLVLLSACGSTTMGGTASFDAGTLGVSGVETGIGVQFEMIAYRSRNLTGWGVGPVLQVAGFTTSGDGDPIALTTIEARWRRAYDHFYWEFGTGLGAAWSSALQRAAVPVQIEAGMRTGTPNIELMLGVRERVIGLVGTGSPPFDGQNSLQAVLKLGLRDARR